MSNPEKMDLRGIEMGFSYDGDTFNPVIHADTGIFMRKLKVSIPRDENTWECPSKMISDFLIAEYKLRVIHQLKKRLATSSQGKGDLPADEFKWIGPNYIQLETDFHLQDLSLPVATLSFLRIFARNNPRWYLGGSLDDICQRNGGCCGQSCGCCEKRADDIPDGSGVSGHCSWACPCCEARKGYHDVRLKVGDYIAKQYVTALESDNPGLLLRIANDYFSMPQQESDSTQASAGSSKDSTSGGDTESPKFESNSSAHNASCEKLGESETKDASDIDPPSYEANNYVNHDVVESRSTTPSSGDATILLEVDEVLQKNQTTDSAISSGFKRLFKFDK